jgi:hypothetical protein
VGSLRGGAHSRGEVVEDVCEARRGSANSASYEKRKGVKTRRKSGRNRYRYWLCPRRGRRLMGCQSQGQGEAADAIAVVYVVDAVRGAVFDVT